MTGNPFAPGDCIETILWPGGAGKNYPAIVKSSFKAFTDYIP
jgi:hypothetical protein